MDSLDGNREEKAYCNLSGHRKVLMGVEEVGLDSGLEVV